MIKDFKDWNCIKDAIKEMQEFTYKEFLPKEDIQMSSKPVARGPVVLVKKKDWKNIKDCKYDDEYVRSKCVKSYFFVDIYMINKIGSVTIGPNVSIQKTVEFRLTSSIRNSKTKTERIENVATAGITGEYTLQDTLTIANENVNTSEKSSETSNSHTEQINYSELPVERNVVYLEFSKITALFRESKQETFKLLGYNEYHLDTRSVTYMDEERLAKLKADAIAGTGYFGGYST